MGGTCRTREKDEKLLHKFSLRNLKGDIVVGGEILKWILSKVAVV